jgi:hypothetical protein
MQSILRSRNIGLQFGYHRIFALQLQHVYKKSVLEESIMSKPKVLIAGGGIAGQPACRHPGVPQDPPGDVHR